MHFLLDNKAPLETHSKTRLRASPGDNCWLELLKLLSTKSSKAFKFKKH